MKRGNRSSSNEARVKRPRQVRQLDAVTTATTSTVRRSVKASTDGPSTARGRDEEYEVEEIRAKRVERGITEYLIKWVGYTDNDCTWECEENVNCSELVRAFEETEHRRTAELVATTTTLNDTLSNERSSEDYEVEAIRGKRNRKGTIQYLLKWKGYPEQDCTWEDASNANCSDLIRDYEEGLLPSNIPAHASPVRDGVPDIMLTILPTSVPHSASNETTVSPTLASGATRIIEAAAAAASAQTEDDGERHFEVEKLLKKREQGGVIEYLVRWKGLSDEDDSWERGLEANCPNLISEFEESSSPPVPVHGRPRRQRANNNIGSHDYATSDEEETKGDRHDGVIEHSPPPRHSGSAKKATAANARRPSPSQNTQRTPSVAVGLERALIGSKVAFSPATDKWMSAKEYNAVGSTYLVGVVRDYKYSAREGKYEVRWLNTFFQNQVVKIDLMKVIQGRANFERIHSSGNIPRWTHLLKSTSGNALQIADDLSNLVDYEFTVRQEVLATLRDVERIMDVTFDPDRALRSPQGLYTHADGMTVSRVSEETKHLFCHSASSSFFAYIPLSFWRQVLIETNAQFEDFKAKELEEARSRATSSSKPPKVPMVQPFTLDELMKFLGILWFMATVDKGEYANYWGEQVEDVIFGTARLSLDSVMSLRRFRDLRSAFSCRRSSSVTEEDLQRDSAVRIRPLLNILKQTSARHVEVGRDIAVDEATISARSKFARHLIAYNPRKPTGKYHFKLYMTCCSTSWVALSYRLHGESTLQDRAEGVFDQDSTEELQKELEVSTATRQIVLEITRPFYGSGRIVNCDNYYTSVQLLDALRMKGLFCRGTVKRTSKHFPRHVILADPSAAEKNSNKSKAKRVARRSTQLDPTANLEDREEISGEEDDEEDLPSQEQTAGTTVEVPFTQSSHVSGEVRRGDMLQAVSSAHQMLAASWCDGNVVTVVSNADPSTMSTVTRMVQGRDIEVPAPTCIKQYNQHMQGVDRNDQFRSRFSTANGHSFQKWHKKLAIAIMDIARVNAFLTRKLAMGGSRPDRDGHRAFMVELIQELFNGKWREAPGDETMLYDDLESTGFSSIRTSPGGGRSPSALSPSSRPFTGDSSCPDRLSSQLFPSSGHRRKRMCIVCRFEGRKDTLTTVHCLEHKVSMCKRSYEATNPYGCQNAEWSCWDKFHLWYLPMRVFSPTGSVNRSSSVVKEKKRYENMAELDALNGDTAEIDPREVSRVLSFETSSTGAPATPAFSPTLSVAVSTPSWIQTPTPSIEY